MSPISVPLAIHVLITKSVSVDVVNNDAIMLYAALGPLANNRLENVFVKHILLEIRTIYVCHVSSKTTSENNKKIQKKILNENSFFLFSNRNTNMQTGMW